MALIDTYFPKVKNAGNRDSGVLRVFHAVYFVLLTILIWSQVVSKFMMSGMQILLMVNWIMEGICILVLRRRQEGSGASTSFISSSPKSSRWLLYAYLVMMGVHLLWLIGSGNMKYGLDDIFRKLPLLAIPLVVLTSPRLNSKQIRWLLFSFVGMVFIVTMIGVVRLLTIPDLPYREIVPYISHIRFSLNICVAIVLLASIIFKERTSQSARLRFLPIVLIVWFVVFLFILRSYTAFFVLFVTAWVMLALYWRRMGKRHNWVLLALVALTIAIAMTTVGYVKSYYGDYYRMHTGLVENGNLLNDNISRAELEQQWTKRSEMGIYDTTPNGYTVYPTLLRYLNASGMGKDSSGICQLTDRDISLIEKGVANPVYEEKMPMKKMCYVLLFEYENWRVYGSIQNSSVLERIELWCGAWRVFCDNPLFGVGTGDGVDALHEQLRAEGSQIADTQKHAHNQYLSFLVSFGLVGFLLIAIVFAIAFRKIQLKDKPAFFAIVIILLLSCISEDTLETLAGCVLCTVIPCLMALEVNNKNNKP